MFETWDRRRDECREQSTDSPTSRSGTPSLQRGVIAAHEAKWREGSGSREQWLQSLHDYAFPKLGKLLVAEVDTAIIVACLEPIWRTKHETARRVRNRIEQILDYAKVKLLRSGDNPASWDLIKNVLPHESLPYSEVPALMAGLRGRPDVVARAIELCILTATRASECAEARWEEFNLAEATLDIPGVRMKGGKPHRAMLSPQAVTLLRDLPRSSPYIFPLRSGDKPIFQNRLLQFLRKRMGHRDVTIHGFRSSFKSWATERTRYPLHVAEMCLAHTVGSEVERAYQRAELIEQRRRLMNEWAGWCSRPVPTGATIVTLHG